MAQVTLIVTSLLLALALPFGARGQTCKLLGGRYRYCQCQMSDGSGIVDLSPYANENGDPEFTVKHTSGSFEYEYNINFCFALRQGDSCDVAAGCQSRASDNKQWSMGRFVSADFIIDPQDGFYLQFTDGDDDRKMKIFLVCDKNLAIDKPDFQYGGENEGYVYDFTLKSPCACPVASGVCGVYGDASVKESSDPGVVGIVLMCLAFTALVTYFIVGAVIMRVRYDKTGTDLIIHKNFWKDFPFLVKILKATENLSPAMIDSRLQDGVVFTFAPCYNAIRRRRGYSSLDK